MFEAKFYLNPNPAFPNMPCFSFLNEEENKKYWMLDELTFCDNDYIIDDVMPNLRLVMEGSLETFDFGYDATIIDFYPNESIINYSFGKKQIKVDSKSLYDFLENWSNYLKNFL